MDGASSFTADTETLNTLLDELKEILSVDSIDPDSGLGELGIDSLNIVELLLVCEKVYTSGVNPADLAIDQYTSIRDLDRQLRGEGVQ